MPTLYVLEPDTRLEKEYGRLLVTRQDEVILRLALENVSAVVLVGNAGATTQALHALLRHGAPLYLTARSGELLGRLLPPTGFNLPLRQQQYRRNDQPEFCLHLARQIVAAKVHNQFVLAKRILRRRISADLLEAKAQLDRARTAIPASQEIDSLLGMEGSAASAYFEIYRSAFDPEWDFTRRTRRPPKDPVNALLSLGYTFLGYAMLSALEVAGLDPYLGYFHQEEYGRPALALDLIEEFRAPIVDALVMGLVNRKLLRPDDFEPGEGGGIFLTRGGMRIFVREFEDRLETQHTVPKIGRPLSYRKLFEVQACNLARLIQGEMENYQPFRWR